MTALTNKADIFIKYGKIVTISMKQLPKLLLNMWTTVITNKEKLWLKLLFIGEKNAIDAIDVKRCRHRCY